MTSAFYLVFYFYAFLTPFQYIQEKIPKGPEGINYANLMIGVMILGWFMIRSVQGKPLAVRSPLNIVLILFIFWHYFGMWISYLGLPGIDSPWDPTSPAMKHFYQYANCFLMFYLGANLFRSRKPMHHCVLAIALAAPLVFRVFYNQLQSVSAWHYNDSMRITGPFVWIGSNELGAFFLYNALFFMIYGFYVKKLLLKGFYFFSSSLYIYGILYSYSRATQLSFIAAVGLMAATRHRWVLILMIGAWATMSLWVPASVKDRWEMTENEEGQLDASAQSRKDFWALAGQLYLQNPVTGFGVGSFKVLNPARMDTHNLYYRTLAEGGTPGIVLLMATWFTIIYMGLQLWRHGPVGYDRHFGFAMIIITVALMIANYFGDRFTHLAMIGQYWVLIGMGARLYANMKGYEALDEDATEAVPGMEASAPSSSAAKAAPALAPAASRRKLWIVGGGASAPLVREPALAPKVVGGEGGGEKKLRLVGRSVTPKSGV